MRRITQAEGRQRGCIYCKNVKRSTGVSKSKKDKQKYISKACPYDKCPYTVLDEYKSYSEYEKSLGERYAEVLALFEGVSA